MGYYSTPIILQEEVLDGATVGQNSLLRQLLKYGVITYDTHHSNARYRWITKLRIWSPLRSMLICMLESGPLNFCHSSKVLS